MVNKNEFSEAWVKFQAEFKIIQFKQVHNTYIYIPFVCLYLCHLMIGTHSEKCTLR